MANGFWLICPTCKDGIRDRSSSLVLSKFFEHKVLHRLEGMGLCVLAKEPDTTLPNGATPDLRVVDESGREFVVEVVALRHKVEDVVTAFSKRFGNESDRPWWLSISIHVDDRGKFDTGVLPQAVKKIGDWAESRDTLESRAKTFCFGNSEWSVTFAPVTDEVKQARAEELRHDYEGMDEWELLSRMWDLDADIELTENADRAGSRMSMGVVGFLLLQDGGGSMNNAIKSKVSKYHKGRDSLGDTPLIIATTDGVALESVLYGPKYLEFENAKPSGVGRNLERGFWRNDSSLKAVWSFDEDGKETLFLTPHGDARDVLPAAFFLSPNIRRIPTRYL